VLVVASRPPADDYQYALTLQSKKSLRFRYSRSG
jgi:hypothetical protein